MNKMNKLVDDMNHSITFTCSLQLNNSFDLLLTSKKSTESIRVNNHFTSLYDYKRKLIQKLAINNMKQNHSISLNFIQFKHYKNK